LFLNAHFRVQYKFFGRRFTTFEILQLFVNICSIFHYGLQFTRQLVHCFFVISLFLLSSWECTFLSWYLSRRHVSRWILFNGFSMIYSGEHWFLVQAIGDLVYLFVISVVVVKVLRFVRRHHWFTKTRYVFRIFTKGWELVILLILSWTWTNFLWLLPEALRWWFNKSAGYSFLCNAFGSMLIISSRTNMWIIIYFPQWISSFYPKCSKTWLWLELQIVLILPRIRRIFPRLMIEVNWVRDKSRSWFRYCFRWLSSWWFFSQLLLILIPNSKRFSSRRKSFRYMILTWIRRHFVLFPFISLSYNLFIRRARQWYTCDICNLRTYSIKASSRIISSRTWTSFRRLWILNFRWKIVMSTVFFSKGHILLYIFTKSWFISNVLTWSTWRILNYSLLYTVFYKC